MIANADNGNGELSKEANRPFEADPANLDHSAIGVTSKKPTNMTVPCGRSLS